MNDVFIKFSVALTMLGGRAVHRVGEAQRRVVGRGQRDRGASSVEWVIITLAVLAGAAIIGGVILALYNRGASKVNDVEF
ncbi:hypothetical protein HX747_30310 [Streptomyces sp. L06]|nr:hypothetical protein [Streptomyces sp. L06]